MKASIHSHCAASDTFPKAHLTEIKTAIASINALASTKAATKLRDDIIASLLKQGWSGETKLAIDSNITITSTKSSTGLCLQTGNMSRMYADLLKLQTMYLNGSITCAALIVPSAPLAAKLGDNIANATRLERELSIFRKVIHIPIYVIAIEE